MAAINPYLIFDGKCEQAFLFYKSVFGGEFNFMARFGDMPPMDGQTIDPKEADLVMHVSLPISKETVIMGSDCPSSQGPVNYGNNFSISVNTDGKEEADKIFNGLSAGGKVIQAMHQSFWGAYFGMFTDKFDVNWMVNFDENPAK